MSMYIFTPGPVKTPESILSLGAQQSPYFRNEKFSKVVLECEKYLLLIAGAPPGSRVIFLTASGTAAMEATVVNLLGVKDKTIVINGGGFGQRFVDICNVHNIPIIDHTIRENNLSRTDELNQYSDSKALLINAHETTVGLLYDLDSIGTYCRDNSILNIVDAISMFITDDVQMTNQCIDALIVSSQKGLALPPGLSMVILTPEAISKIKPCRSYYFDFKTYLGNGVRGQTPFTPAVNILIQLHSRLQQIVAGSVEQEIRKAKEIAEYFRSSIVELPLRCYSKFMPNAMTALSPTDGKKACEIAHDLYFNYNIAVAPNGGELKDIVFRVSHMGDMTKQYVDILLNALYDYYGVNR